MIKKMTLSLIVSLCLMAGASHAQTAQKDNAMLNFLLGEMAVQRNDLPTASNYLEKITQNQNYPYVLRLQFNIAFGQGDYVKALSILSKMLADEPEDLEIALFESVIYLKLTDYDKAAFAMDRAAKLYQKSNNNDNGYHFIYRELKGQVDTKAFLEVYRKIAAANLYSIEVTPLLASLLVDNGEYQEALQFLEGIIKKDPESAINYALLMYVYVLENKPQEGLAIVKAAAEKSKTPGLRIEYLQILINEFYYEEAIEYAKKLVELYPHNPVVYGNLSYINFALRNDEAVKKSLEKVIQLKGDYASVVFKLADLARTTERMSGLFEILPDINSLDVQVVKLMAEADMALRKKSYATFLAIFDELRSRFPDRVESLYNQQLEMLEHSQDYQLLLPYTDILDVVTNYDSFIYTYYRSVAYQGMKEYEKMQEVLLSWLQRFPEDGMALNGYGYMMLEIAKTQEERDFAIGYIQKAIELVPDDPAIMDSIGWGYFKNGDYVKAREYIYPAYNRLKQPDVIAHYVALLIKEKKIEEAKTLFARLQLVYPEHPETYALLKQYQEVLQSL